MSVWRWCFNILLSACSTTKKSPPLLDLRSAVEFFNGHLSGACRRLVSLGMNSAS